MLSVLRFVFHASTFLPTFPRHGFAFRASRGSHRCSTMRALTPARRSHARQVSSLTPLCLPDIPTPTTSCASNVAFAVTSARPARPVAKSRLRQRSQARQHTPPKRVRHPTGYPFASGYFPPRLAATQLPSASCNVTSHGQDLHLTDKAYSRTYERALARKKKRLTPA